MTENGVKKILEKIKLTLKVLKRLIVRESSSNVINDASIKEKKVNYKVGGFNGKKIIYLVKKWKRLIFHCTDYLVK